MGGFRKPGNGGQRPGGRPVGVQPEPLHGPLGSWFAESLAELFKGASGPLKSLSRNLAHREQLGRGFQGTPTTSAELFKVRQIRHGVFKGPDAPLNNSARHLACHAQFGRALHGVPNPLPSCLRAHPAP